MVDRLGLEWIVMVDRLVFKWFVMIKKLSNVVHKPVHKLLNYGS